MVSNASSSGWALGEAPAATGSTTAAPAASASARNVPRVVPVLRKRAIAALPPRMTSWLSKKLLSGVGTGENVLVSCEKRAIRSFMAECPDAMRRRLPQQGCRVNPGAEWIGSKGRCPWRGPGAAPLAVPPPLRYAPPMDYLAAMRAFVRSAELGSLSRAAQELGSKVSSVSRAVAALEADLGAALLNRSTRGLHLTEVGTAFYERATRLLAELEDARLVASSLNARPQGLLRLNLPAAFGRLHVVPHLAAFMAAYPEVRVDATLTDATVDLIESGTDVAVRIGVLADSALMGRRLAPHRRVLVASPAHVAQAGPPDTPEALVGRACLPFALQPSDRWHFRQGDGPWQALPVTGRLRMNDSEALREAALAGLGIALLPTWVVGPDIDRGALVRLLPEWTVQLAPGVEPAIWAVYPPKRIVSPKVRVFVDFLAERFGRPPYWEAEAGGT